MPQAAAAWACGSASRSTSRRYAGHGGRPVRAALDHRRDHVRADGAVRPGVRRHLRHEGQGATSRRPAAAAGEALVAPAPARRAGRPPTGRAALSTEPASTEHAVAGGRGVPGRGPRLRGAVLVARRPRRLRPPGARAGRPRRHGGVDGRSAPLPTPSRRPALAAARRRPRGRRRGRAAHARRRRPRPGSPPARRPLPVAGRPAPVLACGGRRRAVGRGTRGRRRGGRRRPGGARRDAHPGDGQQRRAAAARRHRGRVRGPTRPAGRGGGWRAPPGWQAATAERERLARGIHDGGAAGAGAGAAPRAGRSAAPAAELGRLAGEQEVGAAHARRRCRPRRPVRRQRRDLRALLGRCAGPASRSPPRPRRSRCPARSPTSSRPRSRRRWTTSPGTRATAPGPGCCVEDEGGR